MNLFHSPVNTLVKISYITIASNTRRSPKRRHRFKFSNQSSEYILIFAMSNIFPFPNISHLICSRFCYMAKGKNHDVPYYGNFLYEPLFSSCFVESPMHSVIKRILCVVPYSEFRNSRTHTSNATGRFIIMYVRFKCGLHVYVFVS